MRLQFYISKNKNDIIAKIRQEDNRYDATFRKTLTYQTVAVSVDGRPLNHPIYDFLNFAVLRSILNNYDYWTDGKKRGWKNIGL